jgi:hypothetical protein
MLRKLARIESQNFQGFGCSECRWMFKPTGPFIGNSFDRMKRAYEAELDKEFAAHVCAQYWKSIVRVSELREVPPTHNVLDWTDSTRASCYSYH